MGIDIKTNRKKNRLTKKKILVIMSLIVILLSGAFLLSKKVTVIIDEEVIVARTYVKNYGQLLNRLEIEIIPEDVISTDINSKIIRGSTIEIKKAQEVTVEVDNKSIKHKTTKDTVGEILEELKIEYDELDKFSMGINETIEKGDIIVISRVNIEEEYVVEEIHHGEEIVEDYKTYSGETRVIKEGASGQKHVFYNVTYEDGKEVAREYIREEIVTEAIDKVIANGIFDPNSVAAVVNKSRYLDADYEPNDLVVPNVRMAASSSRNMMRLEAAEALENMFDSAEEDGIYLYAVSGYRSYYYQSSIYNPYSGYSAPPGASEHQLGLAMDVNTSYSGTTLTTDFAYTTEGQWVASNAHNYGFVVRYMPGKESVTGYYYEPWHIRYVGVDLATELYTNNMTLEEYYGEY